MTNPRRMIFLGFFFVFAFIVVVFRQLKIVQGQDALPVDPEQENIPLQLSERDLDNFLSNIHYYSHLSPGRKSLFRERVREFVESTKIVSTEHIMLSDTLRAFIAASAVQLTFGIKNWELKHFHTIRIYPKDFYSRINNKQLKGGAAPNGVIWFSYKDYMAGYADQENGINLGLHEMSHALMIDMQQGNQDGRFVEAFELMEPLARNVMEGVRMGTVTFLRKYAGTNFSEFFAVSMEHFFEQPAEFKSQLPQLYYAYCSLLNQDPLNAQRDYQWMSPGAVEIPTGPVPVSYDEPVIRKPLKNFRFATWHWSLSVLLMGIFIAPVIFFCAMMSTVVDASVLLGLYIAAVAGGGIYFYKKLVPTQALNFTQFILFLLIGFGPLTVSGVIGINRIIPIHEETETYTMNGDVGHSSDGWLVGVQNSPYKTGMLYVNVSDYDKIRPGNLLIMHFNRGIFWIRIHDHNEIVQK